MASVPIELLLPAALIAEAALGYPRYVYSRIAHPVVWMGWLIDGLERRWNRAGSSDAVRRGLGALTVIIVVGLSAAAGSALQRLAATVRFGEAIVVLAATAGLAQRALYTHVADVLNPLIAGNLADARTALARIVGRDTAALDESGIAAAALESLAESFNDGVVAPAFWLLIGGLPGLFAYKAINTADSMIGHRTERHQDFGKTAAQLDDLVNLPASRLAALLIIAAASLTSGASAKGAWQAMRRDASRHASPNAGYPEAAMAGALGLSLAGPRSYDGDPVDGAWMGDGRREVNATDIHAALALYARADGILIAIVFLLTALILLA
jgi:adenosylcobinamide-phosphate synthase